MATAPQYGTSLIWKQHLPERLGGFVPLPPHAGPNIEYECPLAGPLRGRLDGRPIRNVLGDDNGRSSCGPKRKEGSLSLPQLKGGGRDRGPSEREREMFKQHGRYAG